MKLLFCIQNIDSMALVYCENHWNRKRREQNSQNKLGLETRKKLDTILARRVTAAARVIILQCMSHVHGTPSLP